MSDGREERTCGMSSTATSRTKKEMKIKSSPGPTSSMTEKGNKPTVNGLGLGWCLGGRWRDQRFATDFSCARGWAVENVA